jgi:hypothetical protein
VEASGAWSRGLLVVEAVRAGLASPQPKLDNGRRLRRIDALVPRSLVVSLKKFAAEQGVSQQHLLRLWLFQYIAAAPWERTENEMQTVEAVH